MTFKRSTLVGWAVVIIVVGGTYLARDTILQLLGFGGEGVLLPPSASQTASTVELPEGLAESVRVQAVEAREFPIEDQAVGSIDFNEDILQVFSPYQGRIIDLYAKIGDEVQRVNRPGFAGGSNS